MKEEHTSGRHWGMDVVEDEPRKIQLFSVAYKRFRVKTAGKCDSYTVYMYNYAYWWCWCNGYKMLQVCSFRKAWFYGGFFSVSAFPKARSQKPFVHLMTVRRGRAPIVVVEIACPATFMEIPTICLRLRGRSLKIWDSSLWSWNFQWIVDISWDSGEHLWNLWDNTGYVTINETSMR